MSKKITYGVALVIVAAAFVYFFAPDKYVTAIQRRIQHQNGQENKQDISAVIDQGNKFYQDKKYTEAIEQYKKAISLGDGFAEPHFNLANVYRDSKDLPRSIEEYQKAIAIDPKFTMAYQNLALVYANFGSVDKALSTLEQLKVLTPDQARVYYNMALLYVAKKDKPHAVENLNEAAKYVGTDKEASSLINQLLTLLKTKSL